MSYAFLTPKNIFDRYDDAKLYTRILTKPFPEFERIARNLPHPSIDKRYPKTTDGTTASIIRKTPRRVIQQLPTGSVKTDENNWLGIVAGFIYTHKIIPFANEEYSLIQKGWSAVERGLTFGATASYTPFLNHDGEFGPDMILPYWGDVFLQRGKKSGYDCSYVFLRSWWQKVDLEELIDRETKLKKKDKSYDSSWDVVALKSILNAESTKDALALTPSERERMATTSGIELVTGFQKGVGATFYTFNPVDKVVVRTKDNKDPRGKIPIDWMYGDIDGSNPWGRGIVELVGSLQNLIDSDMQMYQFNRALLLAPPIMKHGNFSRKKIVFEPNAIIDLGTDPNAKIEALEIDTSAIAAYPSLYGLQKSQLLNLTNSPDTSISADIGNPGFSKTDSGVKQQTATVSIDDNYVRKMFEVWFQNWSETAINIYFAERTGIEELQLDKETAMQLRELPNFDMSMLSEDNKIRVDYDSTTPELKFKVDPSTTSVQDKASQVQSATQLLDIVMKYSMLNANFGGPIDVDVLARRIVVNSGIDDPEQVAPEPTEAQKQQKEEQKNQVSPFSPMYDKPQLRINSADLSADQLAEVLANAGIHAPAPQPGQEQSPQEPAIKLADIYKSTTDPLIKAQIEQMMGLQPHPQSIQNQMDTNASQGTGTPQPPRAPSESLNYKDAPEDIKRQIEAQAGLQPSQAVSPVQTQLDQKQQEINNSAATSAAQIHQQGQQNEQAAKQQGSSASPKSAAASQSVQPAQSAPTNPHDAQIVTQLKQLGFSDQIIQEAIDMLNNGYSEHQVLQALSQVQKGGMA